nr:hypothetical protein [Tanacetum cinerariifolium]
MISSNALGLIQGHLDPPLSKVGQEQAEKLADHLKTHQFTEAWSADLLRASQ